jgi:hypothetical protein
MAPSSICVAYLLVLTLLGLSGCVSSGPDGIYAPTPDPDEAHRTADAEEQPPIVLAEGRAAIAGHVTDDTGFSLPDAHVALLRTDNATRTDRAGWFNFTNLTPGDYAVRVDLSGYRAGETEVATRPDEVSRIEITLVPVDNSGAGYRPHIHDYWAERTELTVVDGAVDWYRPVQRSEPYATVFRYEQVVIHKALRLVCMDTQGHVEPYDPPIWFADPGQLVIPGTAEIRVQLRWTQQDFNGDKLFVAWHPANGTNISSLGPIRNGETATIAVVPQMWDSGHQSFTLWRFWLCMRDERYGAGNDEAMLMMGSVHVVMTLVRGDDSLPMEPPHPKFWANGNVLQLGENLTKKVRNTLLYTFNHHARNPEYTWQFADGKIVPPGTTMLTLRLDWSYGGPLENRPFSLTYRPANGHPSKEDPGEMLKPVAAEKGANHRVYRIALEPGQTDAFYQRRSNWLFMFNTEGEEAEALFTNPCVCEVTLRFSASAERGLGSADSG